MAEEIIDFGNFSKKITVNPIVPLQMLQLKYRNSQRIQATIIGKVYSSHIDILDLVPISMSEENKVTLPLDSLNLSISHSTREASRTSWQYTQPSASWELR